MPSCSRRSTKQRRLVAAYTLIVKPPLPWSQPQLQPQRWSKHSALELADGPAWGESVAAFATIADELRLPHELALAATMATTAALIEGRYADAEMLSQRALSLGTEVGDPNASAVHLTKAVLRGLPSGHVARNSLYSDPATVNFASR